ncbi:ComEA family DNA-binding protein [Tepidimonas charontis]|uniref:ComEA family DNA-binding protein n=1 Tax=Tepidimonas charontis TaxID=2267262 RepID=UPI001375AC16|nr:helix-hairpin-helix domain-containing protein [Tepidimonas charontis]
MAVAWPAHAQIEVNRATAEALMQLPGIGPVRAERIVQARAQRPFTDWADLQARVAGIGPKTAETLSLHGLRVQGRSYGQDVAQGKVMPAPRSAAQREPPRAGEAALSSRPAAPAR